MSQLQDQIVSAVLECANCSRHATVAGALSETIATVSLSTSDVKTKFFSQPIIGLPKPVFYW